MGRSLYRFASLAVLLALLQAAHPAHARVLSGERVRSLLDVTRASRKDCLLAVSRLLAGQRAPESTADTIEFLGHCQVITPEDLDDLDRPATRGFASKLFLRALGERGGLFLRLCPHSERYAYKHLEYLRMFPEGSGEQVIVSGPELFALLGLCQARADRVRAAHGRPPGKSQRLEGGR